MPLRARQAVSAARHPKATVRRIRRSPSVRRTGATVLRQARRFVPIPPVLSVIVPVYNVEDYLEDCLESLLRQSLVRMEIIAVNDGSTDRSAEILHNLARRNPRAIRVIDQPNAGLGAARNTGIAAARGQFLTFVDSDDMVPATAYKVMIHTLRASGSDFVVGSVQRQRRDQRYKTSWVYDVHDRDRIGVTIDEFPQAIYDCFAWNKVYRTEFFRRAVGTFPEGLLYEDQVPSAKAFLAARSFDVLEKVTYYWRLRVTGDSITQTTSDLKNLRDRLTVQREVNRLLTENGRDRLRQVWLDQRVIGNDITLYTRDVDRAGDEYWLLLREWVQTLFEESDWLQLHGTKTSKLVLAWLVAHSDRSRVEDFVQYERDNPGGFPTSVVDGTVFADLPFRGDPAVGVPDELYAMSEEQFQLDSSVRLLRWLSPRELEITAWAYLRSLNLDDLPSETTILLRHVDSGEQREFPVRPCTDLRVTERVRHTWMPYDQAGFAVVVDVTELLDRGRAEFQDHFSDKEEMDAPPLGWEVWVRVSTGGHTKEAPLVSAVTNGSARMPMASLPVDGVQVLPEWQGGVLVLRAMVLDVVAHRAELRGRELAIKGTLLTPLSTVGELVLRGNLRGAAFHASAELSTEGDGRFTAQVRVPDVKELRAKDLVAWSPRVVVDGVSHQIGWVTDDLRTVVDGVTGLRMRRTLHGNLTVEERCDYFVLEAISVDGDDLIITGQVAGVALRGVVLKSKRLEIPAEHLTVEGSSFVARVPLTRAEWQTTPLPLPVGTYSILARYSVHNGGTEETEGRGEPECGSRRLLADRPLIERSPYDLHNHMMQVGVGNKQEVWFQIKPQLKIDEASPYHQNRLQREVYEPARHAPREDAVLFEAFKGQYAACNPRAICEELQRRGSDLSLYWSVTDLSVPVPQGTIPLVRLSAEWYEKLGRAKYLVNNNNFPKFFSKAPGQVYLETWHGTPLKRIGHDIHKILFSYRNYLDTMDREAATWDFLVSPNDFSTAIFPRAFAYDGPVLETGYPRNDVLVNAPSAGAARVRSLFGIDSTKRIVLYAPTWRDDQYASKPGEYQSIVHLDIPRVLEELGDEFVVLVRGHSNTLAHGQSIFGEGVIDATRYPDINDLYSAGDVLITDYSSVMFDYAVTGKPILYLVPDLEDYRDRVRGFYFDFEQEAPGPLLSDTTEVLECLRDLDGIKSTFAARYADFRSRFTSLEDGGASRRVVDAVFGEPT